MFITINLSGPVNPCATPPQKEMEHFLREINLSNGNHYNHGRYQCEVCYTIEDLNRLKNHPSLRVANFIQDLVSTALEELRKMPEISENRANRHMYDSLRNDFKKLNPANAILFTIISGCMSLVVPVVYISYNSNNACGLLCDDKQECKYRSFCEFYEQICRQYPFAVPLYCLAVFFVGGLMYFLIYKPAYANCNVINKASRHLPNMVVYATGDIENHTVRKLEANGWLTRMWRGKWSLSTEIE